MMIPFLEIERKEDELPLSQICCPFDESSGLPPIARLSVLPRNLVPATRDSVKTSEKITSLHQLLSPIYSTDLGRSFGRMSFLQRFEVKRVKKVACKKPPRWLC